MLERLRSTLERLTALGGEEKGQALMEYALVLALVALVAVFALTLIRGPVTSAITTVAQPLAAGPHGRSHRSTNAAAPPPPAARIAAS